MKLKPGVPIAAGVVLFLLVSAGALVFQGLNDFDLSEHHQQEVVFQTESAELSGTLILPSDNPAAPILIFVHGDGPQDRFSSGGYMPLMNALLDSGIAVYSWDKAGVGTSAGDWLQQTMADRAAETMAAMSAVQSATEASGNKLGFIGFSQAGWVLPKVATQVSPSIPGIIVGGASSWQEQGAYLTATRLKAEAHTDDDIRAYVQQQVERDEKLFAPPVSYERYLEQTTEEAPMSEARFHFVALNYSVDSTEELPRITSPMLVLFGEDDLNVDARSEARVYEQGLANGHDANEVVVWPEATHALTRTRWFNYRLPSQIPWYATLYALAAGREIYAPGVVDHIADWFLRTSQ
ncbi:alpha/beta hydrolase family protein [Halomonas nitroreducens]|uniref:Alpha/beta hydrolase n=1 Tax=Halomonas nitroreducens TaxID=447425 RepID=A0A3S0JBU2_9GAMM|nr:alpha/beta hydrolase [Halomonas nitroreducens]RTR05876.1 alpha/beta hydrolase [Halomonas nitroreducens]